VSLNYWSCFNFLNHKSVAENWIACWFENKDIVFISSMHFGSILFVNKLDPHEMTNLVNDSSGV